MQIELTISEYWLGYTLAAEWSGNSNISLEETPYLFEELRLLKFRFHRTPEGREARMTGLLRSQDINLDIRTAMFEVQLLSIAFNHPGICVNDILRGYMSIRSLNDFETEDGREVHVSSNGDIVIDGCNIPFASWYSGAWVSILHDFLETTTMTVEQEELASLQEQLQSLKRIPGADKYIKSIKRVERLISSVDGQKDDSPEGKR